MQNLQLLIAFLCLFTKIHQGTAFCPVTRLRSAACDIRSSSTTDTDATIGGDYKEDVAMQEQSLNQRLEDTAHKLRLQVYDVDTGVFGFESKDTAYGIENIHTRVHIDPTIGLELTELAHSDVDHRGLVLVSKVSSNALHETPIQVGDTIIGVFAGADFAESTTGLDYDETVATLARAKDYCTAHDLSTLTLEVNRLVPRAAVTVEVWDRHGDAVGTLHARAGDNLRILLLKNSNNLYDPAVHRRDQPHLTGNCGGDGVCGTCMVSVVSGGEHLNKIGPQEESLLMHRPASWRAACKTVVGADNQADSKLTIQLQPFAVQHQE